MNEADRRFSQFEVRHLFGLITCAAVTFAIVAPVIRELDHKTQVVAARKTVVAVLAATALTVFLAIRRRRIERKAGPLLHRCERKTSRVVSWLIGLSLWVGYAGSIWSDWVTNRPRQANFTYLPGSPVLLLIAVNFMVVRVWWRVDPAGIEICEHGLILGGFSFYSWDEIDRHSWSGDPPNRLNLFLKRRFVMNLKIDSSFHDWLEPALAEHIGKTLEPESESRLARAAGEGGHDGD